MRELDARSILLLVLLCKTYYFEGRAHHTLCVARSATTRSGLFGLLRLTVLSPRFVNVRFKQRYEYAHDLF
jgi:hypothetical protein